MDRSDRFDRILEKENRPPTRQNRVLEKQTRRRPPEKSDRSAADRVRSAGAGGSGWPSLWTALSVSIAKQKFSKYFIQNLRYDWCILTVVDPYESKVASIITGHLNNKWEK